MRPIILGMNNPKSGDPDKVLLPTDEPGSAGNRLWSLSGMTETQYLLAFERRNLVAGPTWNQKEATSAASEFYLRLHPGSTVVVLGREVWKALQLRAVDPLRSITVDVTAVTRFYLVPHPSGRNLWYNDEKNRARVGRLLRRLAR